jgi:thymidylate kinase
MIADGTGEMLTDSLSTRAECNHDIEGTLPLIDALRGALAAAGIRYCQWKGHWKRFRWGRGEGDIDILVHRADWDRLAVILGRLAFKQALSGAGQVIPGVFHYYGFDARADKIIHLHIYSQLILGDVPARTYHVPIEEVLLQSSVPGGFFLVPAPEFELILFVLRTVLRHSWKNMFRSRDRQRLALAQREFEYLEARSDREKLSAALHQYFPSLEPHFFRRCMRSAEGKCSAWAQLGLKRQLQRKLKAYAVERRLFPILQSTASRLVNRIRTRLFGAPVRTRLATGGVLVALVGGDGAGKSTLVKDLHTWLDSGFDTRGFHLGKPPRSALTVLVSLMHRGWARLCRLGWARLCRLGQGRRPASGPGQEHSAQFPGYLQLVRWVCLAYDRYRLYARARRLAAQGAIAVCDRYPVPQIEIMDGPNIGRALGSQPPTWLSAFLLKVETSIYRRILPPDILVLLRVDPEVAARRKTDENADYVRERCRAIWERDWRGVQVHILDADRPLEQIREEVRSLVWSKL